VATTRDPITAHLDEAIEHANTATANVIAGTGEARLCELGILHALIALVLTLRHGIITKTDRE
jgi:hypothetical protein